MGKKEHLIDLISTLIIEIDLPCFKAGKGNPGLIIASKFISLKYMKKKVEFMT